MNRDQEPVIFEVGDRLEYLGGSSIEAPAAFAEQKPDTLLKPGMIGIVTYSQPGWTDPANGTDRPAQCRIKFGRGYEVTIYADSKWRFKKL
jgi:hypothetical protein